MKLFTTKIYYSKNKAKKEQIIASDFILVENLYSIFEIKVKKVKEEEIKSNKNELNKFKFTEEKTERLTSFDTLIILLVSLKKEKINVTFTKLNQTIYNLCKNKSYLLFFDDYYFDENSWYYYCRNLEIDLTNLEMSNLIVEDFRSYKITAKARKAVSKYIRKYNLDKDQTFLNLVNEFKLEFNYIHE